MNKKLLIIGLDCAAPELVFDKWADYLPNIKSLVAGGIYGKLLSTDPPITVPAWTSMMTGKDPGTLGMYGFRNRRSYDYGDLFVANNVHVKSDRVWDILSRHGKRSIVLGVPQTYPPKPLNGLLASGFLAPDKESRFTYPDSFKHTLEDVSGGYIIDIENFRTESKDKLLEDIYTMTNHRFKAVNALIEREIWDFFMFVEMGVDRIHHGFWRYTDPSHRLYESGNPYETAIMDYYIHLDGLIGELLEKLDEETAVMVVSDHGAKSMLGGIAINDWLIEKGYLRLLKKPDTVTPLRPDMVDWERTIAWGEGGYYSRVFMNVVGREPRGSVLPAEYEKTRDRLIRDLKGMCDERGNRIGTKAMKPQEIYKESRGIPPDLMVYLGNLDWRSIGGVGYDGLHVFENDTGPDDANHDYNGILIYKECLSKKGSGTERHGLRIYDVASTVLDYFGLVPNKDMIGRPIL